MGLQTFDFLGASTENVMGLTSSFGIDGQPDPRISGGTKPKLPKSGESDKAGLLQPGGEQPPIGSRAAPLCPARRRSGGRKAEGDP